MSVDRRGRGAAVLAATALAVAACSTGSSPSPTGTSAASVAAPSSSSAAVASIAAASTAASSTAASSQAAASASAGTPGAGVTIGFSMPELTASFWISAAYGVDTEAKAEGATVIKSNAGGDYNSDQQISGIQDLIQKKVSVIIVGATDGNAVKAVVEQAVAAGIPVVGISSIPNSDKIVSAVGADHYGMGKLQAQCLGTALAGKGNVALLGGPPAQSWADEREKGFTETIASTFPSMKVVAEDRTAWDRANGLKVMQAWIQKYPDLAGAYSAYDDIGAGAIDAIKAAGKTGQILVSSSNLSQIGEELLKSGDLVCETTQQVVVQGIDAVQQAVRAATGGAVDKSVITSAVEVTKDNLATTDFTPLRAPAGYTP